MPQPRDITSKRFGKLVVIRRAPNDGKRSMWLCRCDCGGERVIRGGSVTSGHTVSCGCVGLSRLALRRTKHGLHKSRAYRIWVGIWQRCGNPKNPGYVDYGRAGITVCDRWRSFENFFADMGHPPAGTSIDRFPNNRGNYEPGNCRWATIVEQQRNTKSNINVTWQGETMCIQAWAVRLGMCHATLYGRIVRSGWPIERAFTRPVSLFGDRQPRAAA